MRIPFALLALAFLASFPATAAPKPDARSAYETSSAVARERVTALRGGAAKLKAVAQTPVPAGLTTEEIAVAKRFQTWVGGAGDQVTALAASWEAKIRALREACEKNPDCDREALARAIAEANAASEAERDRLLRTLMTDLQRHYEMLSSLMKAQHDAAMAAISNLKG